MRKLRYEIAIQELDENDNLLVGGVDINLQTVSAEEAKDLISSISEFNYRQQEKMKVVSFPKN